MGEKENGSCAVERCRIEEDKAVTNRLMLATCLSPRARVIFRPRLLLMAMFGSMVLSEQGSVFKSMTHVATKDHKDACVSGPTSVIY